MDKEPFGVNGQADCIVYQGKRDESQNDCQPQQHQTDIADVLIHRINQVFLIKHLLYIRILPDFLLYLGDAVRIGVTGMQFNFNGRRKRVIAEKLLRVCSHCLGLLAERLLFGDILRFLHKRFFIQFFLQLQYIALLHVVADENGEVDILLYVYGKVVSAQYKEHHQPQQQQHQRSAYAGCDELHIKTGHRLVFSFLIHFQSLLTFITLPFFRSFSYGIRKSWSCCVLSLPTHGTMPAYRQPCRAETGTNGACSSPST